MINDMIKFNNSNNLDGDSQYIYYKMIFICMYKSIISIVMLIPLVQVVFQVMLPTAVSIHSRGIDQILIADSSLHILLPNDIKYSAPLQRECKLAALSPPSIHTAAGSLSHAKYWPL